MSEPWELKAGAVVDLHVEGRSGVLHASGPHRLSSGEGNTLVLERDWAAVPSMKLVLRLADG